MTYLDELAAKIRQNVADPSLVPDNAEHLFLLYALLGRAKGNAVTAADVHDAWTLWMQDRDGAHDALIPYEELDEQTAKEDEPFLQAIRAAMQS